MGSVVESWIRGSSPGAVPHGIGQNLSLSVPIPHPTQYDSFAHEYAEYAATASYNALSIGPPR